MKFAKYKYFSKQKNQARVRFISDSVHYNRHGEFRCLFDNMKWQTDKQMRKNMLLVQHQCVAYEMQLPIEIITDTQ